ncbi:CBS domain-containing protein [Balneola sp. MJW-20]|uniref:CBS domain-containing protein n=1 Tax=Gracilimonas aurantiaca TaxID=3234185 RepID=UPI0034678688
MLVNEILNNDIPPLKQTDTVALALTKMDLMHTSQYCVIDEDNKLVGMVGLDQAIETADQETTLDKIGLKPEIYVPQRQHVFEAVRIMLAHNLYALPVVDESHKYVGIVEKREIIRALGDLFNLTVPGSVLTVEVDQQDFSLTDLVRIIENEGAGILGLAIQQPQSDNPFYRVSFKVNLEDSSVLSSGLRRFGYTVISEESSESFDMDFSDRADELIRYLDI